MLCESCLFPAPPEYRAPEQTPPFLWDAIPATTRVHAIKSGDSFNISVRLRSEDAGEDLLALTIPWYLEDTAPQVGAGKTIAAGTLAEERTIEATWTVPVRETSCVPLSLVVSHESNFKASFPSDDSDVFVLTWWLAVNGTEQTIANCMSKSQGASP